MPETSLCAWPNLLHNFKTISVEEDMINHPRNVRALTFMTTKDLTLMYTYYWLQAAHAVSLDCVRTVDTLYRSTNMQFNGRQSL